MSDEISDFGECRDRLALFLWNSESTDQERWERQQPTYRALAGRILNTEGGYAEVARAYRERREPARYRAELDLVDAEIRLSDIDAIMEKLREYGHAELVRSGPNNLPIAIKIVFTVGPGMVAEDLWELHGVVGEVEADLSSFTSRAKLDKPELIVEGE